MILFRDPGRFTGLWYFVLILLGPVRLLYIPSKLFVSGDAAATMGNIVANEGLFRFGMVTDLVCAVLLLVVTLGFHRLFEGDDRYLAAWS